MGVPIYMLNGYKNYLYLTLPREVQGHVRRFLSLSDLINLRAICHSELAILFAAHNEVVLLWDWY